MGSMIVDEGGETVEDGSRIAQRTGYVSCSMDDRDNNHGATDRFVKYNVSSKNDAPQSSWHIRPQSANVWVEGQFQTLILKPLNKSLGILGAVLLDEIADVRQVL